MITSSIYLGSVRLASRRSSNGRAGVLSEEGASVLSTVARHLAFLDSELVARSAASSTFDPEILLKPGTSLFLQIPPNRLEAQKGLLRCWISTLVRMIGATGDERAGEVLFLIDEASALGSLSALEEALVRGRSAGVRMLVAYQSDSQVQAAFKDKPTLLYDNCTTQIYLGASSIKKALKGFPRVWGNGRTVLEHNRREHFPLVERRRRRTWPGPAAKSGQLFQLLCKREGMAPAG